MTPAENPNTTNKIGANSNSHSHNNIPTSASAASNVANSSTAQRQKKGTVPKSSTKSTASGPKPLLQPSGGTQMTNRCSPLNIVASIQQHPRTHLHKNTEIVAPIRRDFS